MEDYYAAFLQRAEDVTILIRMEDVQLLSTLVVSPSSAFLNT